MNKSVIYTSLIGGYDELPNYEILDPEFDYICFTNDYPEGTRVGQWEIKSIITDRKLDNISLSRYPKLMPHKFLVEYECSLWIDSNLIIKDKGLYDRIKKLIREGESMACINHPKYNSLYQDAKQCIHDGRDYAWRIVRQINHMRSDHYPDGMGLYENNVIFRRHNVTEIVNISIMWWNEFCTFSKRDQLSLCYVLWKFQYSPNLLLPNFQNTSNSKFFLRKCHSRTIGAKIKTGVIRIINYVYVKFH